MSSCYVPKGVHGLRAGRREGRADGVLEESSDCLVAVDEPDELELRETGVLAGAATLRAGAGAGGGEATTLGRTVGAAGRATGRMVAVVRLGVGVGRTTVRAGRVVRGAVTTTGFDTGCRTTVGAGVDVVRERTVVDFGVVVRTGSGAGSGWETRTGTGLATTGERLLDDRDDALLLRLGVDVKRLPELTAAGRDDGRRTTGTCSTKMVRLLTGSFGRICVRLPTELERLTGLEMTTRELLAPDRVGSRGEAVVVLDTGVRTGVTGLAVRAVVAVTVFVVAGVRSGSRKTARSPFDRTTRPGCTNARPETERRSNTLTLDTTVRDAVCTACTGTP